MIRLEIYPTGQSTPLVPNISPDISFEMIRENPLFERRGDYTYDIDISLKDPHNRKIYQHIDRLYASSKPTGRKIKIICGEETICEGFEVILMKDDDIVKIQVLAGVSGLGYLVADESIRIREMNFGYIPTPTPTKANEVAMQHFPQTNFVFPLVYKNDDGFPENYPMGGSNVNELFYTDSQKLWPQPFLLYYVEKFVELLGYNLTYNALRSVNKWCRLVLVNGTDTLEYAKILPDWSASEFIKNIEQFFNCVFVVDELSKNAEIKFTKEWYKNKTPILISKDKILEDFEREYIEDEGKFFINYKNVSYALPSGNFWKYASIDKKIMRWCDEVTMRPSDTINYQGNQWTVFNDPDYGYKFVRVIDENSGSYSYTTVVNQFSPFIGDENFANTELKIIPTENHLHYIGVSESYGYLVCIKPVLWETQNGLTLKKAIEEGIDDESLDVMQVAFYAGRVRVCHPGEDGSIRYLARHPTCFSQRFFLKDNGLIRLNESDLSGIENMTFDLNGANGRVSTELDNDMVADTTQKHTIYFRAKEAGNPNEIYNFAGRTFICKQLKYTFVNGKRNPVVEGVFYPISS